MVVSTAPFTLVVNDDLLILMDATVIFEDAGFRVHEAMDGDGVKSVLAEHCGAHYAAVLRRRHARS